MLRAAGHGLGLVTGRSRTRHCLVPASSSISVSSYTMALAPTKDSVEHRLSCMIAAHSAVSRRLNEMQCPKDPVLMADLFDTITAAAGSYGCEVWSTSFLAGWHLRDCTLQRFQATVYKQAVKLPRSTSNLLVFLEMGRYPMKIQCCFFKSRILTCLTYTSRL